MIQYLLRDESGATAIEYSVILMLISIAAVIAFTALGLDLADIFTRASDAMARRPGG